MIPTLWSLNECSLCKWVAAWQNQSCWPRKGRLVSCLQRGFKSCGCSAFSHGQACVLCGLRHSSFSLGILWFGLSWWHKLLNIFLHIRHQNVTCPILFLSTFLWILPVDTHQTIFIFCGLLRTGTAHLLFCYVELQQLVDQSIIWL